MKEKILQVDIGDQLPKHGNLFWRKFALFLLYIFGWKAKGVLPNIPKVVLVGAPHTSNWEGILTSIISLALGIRVSWMTKHTLFKRPFGTIIRSLGGIPVDRTAKNGTVAQIVQMIHEHDKIMIAITPEGTRGHVRQWRKGFYYIAQGADIPIVPSTFDYAKKEVEFMPVFNISGDYDADLPLIKSIFEGVTPRHPERL